MGSATHAFTIGCQSLAIVTLVIAVCLTMAAMFTAEWQIANFGNGEYYEHGLIKDCLRSTNQLSGYTGYNSIGGYNGLNGGYGDWMCFWKFQPRYNEEAIASNDVVMNYWQIGTVALLGASCALALVAIVSSCVTCFMKYCAIPWAIFSLLAAILSLAGLIIYLRWSVETGNRVFKLWRLSFEFQMRDAVMHQQYGVSLSIAVGGCVLYFIGTLLAGISIGLVFREARLKSRNGNGNGNARLTTSQVEYIAENLSRRNSIRPLYNPNDGSIKSYAHGDFAHGDIKPSLNGGLDYNITGHLSGGPYSHDIGHTTRI